MPKAQLKVHTENILPIIKKWLYSEKDIFLRELVSNSCDALHKYRILHDQSHQTVDNADFRIDIRTDKDNKQLIISDTGIGMTEEEVEKYIAQIAFSGAKEFVSQYQSNNEKDHIIGHFGLGFYSSYMVAKDVTIQTLSYQDGALPVCWSCDGSTEYELSSGSRTKRGTDVILHLDTDGEEFLHEAKLRQVLQSYCAFLPFPIYLNGSLINGKEPLWLKAPSSCEDKEYIEFYRSLYPMDPDPVFWIHINIDYPFTLKGILYFPKIHRKFDWSDSKIKLFCNRVFVSDNCKDLIPDFLSALKGAIDSPDIPLNVSRSYLQMDRTVRQLSTHVTKKVGDKLEQTYISDKDKFLTIWPDIELIVKLGIMQEEKFREKSKKFLLWKSSSHDWTTLEDYLERNREKTKGKIFYTIDDKHTSSFLDLYQNLGIEILSTTSPVDSTLMTTLERSQTDIHFRRIDAEIDESIIDQSKEKTLLDAEGKTEATRIASLIAEKLGMDQVEVEAKSLASDSLAGFIVINEEMRRMKEYLSLSQQSIPSTFPEKKTFVVNTNSKIVSRLPTLNAKDPDLAKELVMQLYELSLLSQKELDPAQLHTFVQRSERVLEKLVHAQSGS